MCVCDSSSQPLLGWSCRPFLCIVAISRFGTSLHRQWLVLHQPGRHNIQHTHTVKHTWWHLTGCDGAAADVAASAECSNSSNNSAGSIGWGHWWCRPKVAVQSIESDCWLTNCSCCVAVTVSMCECVQSWVSTTKALHYTHLLKILSSKVRSSTLRQVQSAAAVVAVQFVNFKFSLPSATVISHSCLPALPK